MKLNVVPARLALILTPVLGLLFFSLAITIVDPLDYPNNDFFTFWLGGRLALLGQNPYLPQVWVAAHHQFGASWIPNLTFIYPLPLSLLFAPLGWLPLYQAYVVWVLLTQYMIAASLVLLLRPYPGWQIKRMLLPLLAGVILFRPTLLTLLNGQLSGFLLLVLVCMMVLWQRDQWWQGAALLPILALKPNLGVPIIALLVFYLLLHKKISALVAFGVSGIILLLLGFAQNPTWIAEFWSAGNTKLAHTFGYSPTIWGMSALLCNYQLNCSIAIGSALGLLLLIGYVLFLLIKPNAITPTLLVSLAVTLMLLLTPYTWPYDQLLLIIPILTLTMNLASARYPFVPTALIFLTFDVAAIVLLSVSALIQKEIWNVLIPLSVLALLSWYLLKVEHKTPAQNSSPGVAN